MSHLASNLLGAAQGASTMQQALAIAVGARDATEAARVVVHLGTWAIAETPQDMIEQFRLALAEVRA